MTIPTSLKNEHQELHEAVERAALEPGDLGRAAQAVAEKMFPHFQKEEAFAFPPLGYLSASTLKPANDTEEIVAMTERLREELPVMLEEHVQIVAAVQELFRAAKREGRDDYVAFAEKLMNHALMEEEIMYPAALLIGSYLLERALHME